MSGRIVRVLEKTDYNWGGNSIAANTVVNAAAMVVGVDVSSSRETVALIRTHAFNSAGGGSLTVSVYADAPTSEDPGIVFRDTNSPLVNAQAVTTTAGSLYRAVCTNPGGWITIVLSAKQGTSAGVLTGTISIDVSLKD